MLGFNAELYITMCVQEKFLALSPLSFDTAQPFFPTSLGWNFDGVTALVPTPKFSFAYPRSVSESTPVLHELVCRSKFK